MKLSRTLAVLAALALPAAFAAPASALPFSGGSTLTAFEIGPPEDNSITLTRNADGSINVTDALVDPTPTTGCVATADPKTISCTATENTASFQALGGTDVITNSTTLASILATTGGTKLTFTCGDAQICNVTGSTGDDVLIGGTGTSLLNGGAGNDTISGGVGNDSISGGPGNDTIDGGAGSDVITCDAGSDSIKGGDNPRVPLAGAGLALGSLMAGVVIGFGDTYNCMSGTAGITVTLDGAANDGAAGELDNVAADIEAVNGTRFDDTLIGTVGAQLLSGGEGNDSLFGGAGNDAVIGGAGNDTVLGEAGTDTVDGGLGADSVSGGTGEDSTSYADREDNVNVTLDNKANDGAAGEGDNIRPDVENVMGGAGDDKLTGSALANELIGGPGDDTIAGAGGSDEVNGGAGNDKLSGGVGNDELIGGSGSDVLNTSDKQRDIANCGSGYDRVIGQRGFDSIWATCEALGPLVKKKATKIKR